MAQYGAWSWIVAGLLLLGLELVLPGGVLVWLGAAALVTGVLSLSIAVFWPLQFVIFGALALVAIWLWLRVRGPGPVSDRPFLNQRAQRYVGREVVLDQPILDGVGRLSLDDTTWRVTGPDLAAGVRVRIVSAQGAELTVEAA
ncbi:MAG: NfeD family protein [Devosia sp.]|nr:NfeD family protein [Devosia sp.]MBN9317180.1 NfeD family protein [Devosia sp.]